MIDGFVTWLPEPREGVLGTDRSGDPLLTSDDAKPLIARLVRQLWSSNLGHSGAPHTKYYEQYQRMSNPVPGDQVVVSDALIGTDPDRLRLGVGYLIVRRTEWWDTHAEWKRMKSEDDMLTDEDRSIERDAWYIQYGPAAVDVCRWVNCTVITIPAKKVW